MTNKIETLEKPDTFQIQNSENKNFTIAEISEEELWLENFTSKATQATYKDAIKKFCAITGIQNIEELRKVNAQHIIMFREKLRELGETNATINNRMSGLSSLFKHLIEKQIIKANPVYGVKRMKKNYRDVKSRLMANNEVDAMLKQPDMDKIIGLRNKAILSIFFNIGTRRGTIVALRGKDIYEEDGYLIFDMHLKGDKRNRVAVNSHIQASLKQYFEAMGYYIKDQDGSMKLKVPPEAPVFPRMSYNPKMNDWQKPLSGNTIYRMWKKYAEKAGVERTSPHCARTTFITTACDNSKDIKMIQETVGHSDVRTTLSYNRRKVEYKNSASFIVNFG